MVELAAIGTGLGAPMILARLAEALRKVGRHDDALGALGLGVAQAEQQGQHFYDAGLHRLRAEFSSTWTAMRSRSRRRSSANLSRSPGAKRQSPSSCAPPAVWRGSGSAGASATRPAPSLHRSTRGSPKASTRTTCRTRGRCWRSLGRRWAFQAGDRALRGDGRDGACGARGTPSSRARHLSIVATSPDAWTFASRPLPERVSGLSDV